MDHQPNTTIMREILTEPLKGNAADDEMLALIVNGADVNEADPSNMYFRPLQRVVKGERSERIIRTLSMDSLRKYSLAMVAQAA